MARGNRQVFLPWVDGRYGPLDAVISDPSGTVRLLGSSGVNHGRDFFLGAVSELPGHPRAGAASHGGSVGAPSGLR